MFTWCIQVLRSPSFFSREWKGGRNVKVVGHDVAVFRLVEAKWQHCPTR